MYDLENLSVSNVNVFLNNVQKCVKMHKNATGQNPHAFRAKTTLLPAHDPHVRERTEADPDATRRLVDEPTCTRVGKGACQHVAEEPLEWR